MGISHDDIEGIHVRIGSNGDVAVDGIEDKAVREQVQKLIDEKYGNRMYQYYIGSADSVGNLPSNTYRCATATSAITSETLIKWDFFIHRKKFYNHFTTFKFSPDMVCHKKTAALPFVCKFAL